MKRLSFLLLALQIIFYSCHTPPKIQESIAAYHQKDIWESFRKTFQYHIQTIGVSYQQEDNSYIVIISEPPDHTNVSGFNKILENYNADYSIEENNIGVDGWVKDLVIIINDLDKEGFEDFINELHEYMYYTSYKSSYINLPFNGKLNPFLFDDLNYQITASEINKWFLEDNELFVELNTNKSGHNLKQIFDQQITGIFYSVNNGFVIWVLPVNSDISEEKITIRKFVLDADLILGAVSNGKFLAIIGRERQNKLYELPPLRIETILQLAAANKNELDQSYERTNLFAGKLPGGKDWAPIYLSDELLNTEYGSLLNITDQMLKSWSLNGDVEYDNFRYLKPDHWSFRDGVMKDLNVRELTFNWNTKAAAYSVDLSDYEIVALNRTGCLPVSYIPENESSLFTSDILKCEEKAYDYFSNLNNPDLVRVVQYATLYQIFNAFNIDAYGYYSYSNKPYENTLEAEAYKLIKKLATYGENEFQRLEESISEKLSKSGYYDSLDSLKEIYIGELQLVEEYLMISEQELLLYYDLTYKELDSLKKIYLDELQQIENLQESGVMHFAGLDTLFLIINTVNADEGDFGLRILSKFIANPRQDISSMSEEMQDYYLLAYEIISRGNFIKAYPELFDIDRADIKSKHILSHRGYFNTWIKTPSTVISWSKQDSATSIGGHNLDARISPFKINKTLKSGQFRVIKEGNRRIFEIAESDIRKITPEFLRTAEETNTFGLKTYSGFKDVKIRPRNDVIPKTDRMGRGFIPKHLEISKLKEGYQLNGKQINDCFKLIDEFKHYARNAENADLKSLTIDFKGFTPDEALAQVKSSRISLIQDNVRLKKGNFFNINNERFDFTKAKTVVIESGIRVEIPSSSIKIVNGNAKITIRGITQKIMSKVSDLIQKLFKRATNETFDFSKKLKEELKQFNINEENIDIEILDCSIATLIRMFFNARVC